MAVAEANEAFADAWRVLRGAAEHARRGALDGGGAYALAQDGALLDAAAARLPGDAVLLWRPGEGWSTGPAVPAEWCPLLDLYLPICGASAARPVTVGHLGQSLDGYIATGAGDSDYVNGAANLLHLHRMRALCDAVVVGAETVASDDPQLTTRRVPGSNPLRVVIDPQRRLRGDCRVFTDGAAATLVACATEALPAEGAPASCQVEHVAVEGQGGRLRLDVLLDLLHRRGCAAIFVEGGGATVSRFLDAGLLDRLQLAIAPLLIGRGRPGVRLPGREPLGECLRPAHRCFAMGADILFDCDLRLPAPAEPSSEAIRRIC
jgi:riboflavin-specific deaminase-like protein